MRASIDSVTGGFQIIGVLGDDTCTLRDRVRAAVLNGGFGWPDDGITVGLEPAQQFRPSPGLDLAIAVAILTASGIVPPEAIAGRMFTAELGLDGHLRPVHGIVPILAMTVEGGHDVTAVIAAENRHQATWSPAPRRAV